MAYGARFDGPGVNLGGGVMGGMGLGLGVDHAKGTMNFDVENPNPVVVGDGAVNV